MVRHLDATVEIDIAVPEGMKDPDRYNVWLALDQLLDTIDREAVEDDGDLWEVTDVRVVSLSEADEEEDSG